MCILHIGTLEDVSFSIRFNDGDTITLDPRPNNLSTILNDVVALVQPLETRSGQQVDIKLDLSNNVMNGNVLIDTHIYRVLYHLIRNAIRFSPDDSHITVSIQAIPVTSPVTYTDIIASKKRQLSGLLVGAPPTAAKEKFIFTITNNTITPLDLAIIHNSCHQYYSATVVKQQSTNLGLTNINGVGLGLYIAYHILQSMGATLECNTNDNGDAVFTFSLALDYDSHPSPSRVSDSNLSSTVVHASSKKAKDVEKWEDSCKTNAAKVHAIDDDTASLVPDSMLVEGASEPSAATSSESQCSAVAEDKPLRVLVVDDSPLCQRVLTRILNKHGFDTDTANNGQDACDKLFIEPCVYDIVLMDLRMPLMDGLTATKLCREKDHLNHVPIVVVTAELGNDIREQALSAGANEMLSKPVHSNSITTTIKALIADRNNHTNKGKNVFTGDIAPIHDSSTTIST